MAISKNAKNQLHYWHDIADLLGLFLHIQVREKRY